MFLRSLIELIALEQVAGISEALMSKNIFFSHYRKMQNYDKIIKMTK